MTLAFAPSSHQTMVQLDFSSSSNIWMETAILKWANKLQIHNLAKLSLEAYDSCSLAKRKRSMPSIEEASSYFILDENNDLKFCSRLVQLYIFFWSRNSSLLSADFIDQTILNSKSQKPIVIPGFSFEGPLSPVEYKSVPDKMHPFYWTPSRWPDEVSRNRNAIKKLARYLFNCDDEEESSLLLFIALDIHHLDPLGKFAKAVIESASLIKNSVCQRLWVSKESSLLKFLKNGLPQNEDGSVVNWSASELYNKLVKNNENRFKIAEEISCAIISDCTTDHEGISQARAFSLLAHFGMRRISPIMEKELGYKGSEAVGQRQIEADAEHCLAAKCILGQSGHVFSKMKRAVSVAFEDMVKWASDSEIRKLENSKDIGAMPRILGDGSGRYNTIHSVQQRYLMSQAFMLKQYDVYFEDPDENSKVKVLGLWSNDGAEMACNRNAILATEMFIRGAYGEGSSFERGRAEPSSPIILAMLDGKEDLGQILQLKASLFEDYDPNFEYDIICGRNEFLESEGVFPDKLKKAKNRECVLCDKYKLVETRTQRRNNQNTRDVWVHPSHKVHLIEEADEKNLFLQYNVKASYCLHCKCPLGKKGDDGGWAQALLDAKVYQPRAYEEMVEAGKAWDDVFKPFEQQLDRGLVHLPNGFSFPTNLNEKMKLFKTTDAFKKYKVQYPEYRGSLVDIFSKPDHIMHDIALHGKIHFGEFAYTFITPLIQQLERTLEGQAVPQYVAALTDTGLPHKGKKLEEESLKQQMPKLRKENLVEGIRTASYVSFLSKKSRSKTDLEARVENIMKKNIQLRACGAAEEAHVSAFVIENCRRLKESKPGKDEYLQFLIEITQNRLSGKYASAFVGGVLSEIEIQQVNDGQTLKAAIAKLAPASVEHAGLNHAAELIKANNKFNGRDVDKYLPVTIPLLIKYLDCNLCSPQNDICEQINFVANQIRTSQSQLQINRKTLSAATTAIMEYMEHPSDKGKCQTTIETLTEAVEVAEEEQVVLLEQAIRLAQKMTSLYGNRPLGPIAKVCMEAFNCFMEVVKPFLYPFQFSREALIEKMHSHPARLRELAQMLVQNEANIKFNTHTRSTYMHLLAFHAAPLQLEALRRFNRPLASFALQEPERQNKVVKNKKVSMYSFANRPVGNANTPAPTWKNGNGYLIQQSRMTQLYYSHWIGRVRDPYKCSVCKQYNHNKASSQCPGNPIVVATS